MTVYGPATGNYSAASILAARRANDAKAGDQIINGKFIDNTGGTDNYTKRRKTAVAADPVADYYASQMQAQADSQAKAKAEAERAAQLRTQSAIDTNNAYIPQVNAQTDKQLQQAYITAQQSKINAPQAMAAMGYTGGAAESSLMGLDTNYQNNRNDLETSRNTSLDSIRQNANTIQATGNAQLADLASQYYSQMAAAQEKAQANAQSQANWQSNFDANQQATERSQFTDTAGAYYNDYMAQINKLQGDNDTTNDWQIPILQAQRQQKILDTQGNAVPTISYAQALEAYRQGIRTPEVLSVLGL